MNKKIKVVCQCGNEYFIWNTHYYSRKTKCNECRKRQGDSNSRLYSIWTNIKTRCSNKNTQGYSDYGGRGITMCEEWKNDYRNFKKWAKNNGYNDCLTIERIDNNGMYCPDNCKWETNYNQSRNKRNSVLINLNNEVLCLKDWCEKLNLSYKNCHRYMKNHSLTPAQYIQINLEK